MMHLDAPDHQDQTLLALEPEDVLSNRYRLVVRIGQGGMGIVWKAIDQQLEDREVAIKLLPAALAMNQRAVLQLKREASTCLTLSHPNIVRLLNFEQDQNRGGLAFLVMQYVPGQTLEDLLAKTPTGLPLEQVVQWAAQLGDALDYAHDHEVLHRDIKPANIMVDQQGRACLMDFGIARETRDTMTRVTGRDSSGTLPYMSPQQLQGENLPANDIYSMAATLYEAISGNPPFQTGDLQYQILHSQPKSIDGVADHVNEAILAGLAKLPEDRPSSAEALAATIAGSITIVRGSKKRKRPAARLSNRPRSRRWPTVAVVLAMIALAGGAYAARRELGPWVGYYWLASQVVPYQAEAKQLHEEVETLTENIDAGGVQDLVESGLTSLAQADEAMKPENGRYSHAASVYKVAIGQFNKAGDLARLANKADGARMKWQDILGELEGMDITWIEHKDLPQLWANAKTAGMDGDDAWKSSRFPEATQKWTKAAELGANARAMNTSAAVTKEARTRYQQVDGKVPNPLYHAQNTNRQTMRDKATQARNAWDRTEFVLATESWAEAANIGEKITKAHEVARESSRTVAEAFEKLTNDSPEDWGDSVSNDVAMDLKREANASEGHADFDTSTKHWNDALKSLATAHENYSSWADDQIEAIRSRLSEHNSNLPPSRLGDSKAIWKDVTKTAATAATHLKNRDHEEALKTYRTAEALAKRAQNIHQFEHKVLVDAAVKAISIGDVDTFDSKHAALAFASRSEKLDELRHKTFMPMWREVGLEGASSQNFDDVVAAAEWLDRYRQAAGSDADDLEDIDRALEMLMIEPIEGLRFVYLPSQPLGLGHTSGFWLGQTELTIDQWNSLRDRPKDRFEAGNLPRTNITWDEAQDLCNVMDTHLRNTILNARLPMESEWALACQLGRSGDEQSSSGGGFWSYENSGCQAHPPGSFEASAVGLMDMCGNVYEWCEDRPPGREALRPIRGGAFNTSAESCQPTARRLMSQDQRAANIGMRLLLQREVKR